MFNLPKPDRRFEPGGKGHQRRPGADDAKYATGWDAIFGKKEKENAATLPKESGGLSESK